MSDHARLFAFEDDFVTSLRCIPMAVRFKLDLAGVKLSLRQWSRLATEDRRALLLQPCSGPAEIDAYRVRLVELIEQRLDGTVKPLPPNEPVPWTADDRTPATILAFAVAMRAEPVPDSAWRDLTGLERFALLKLSRDNHDNVNFIPALKEFGLYRLRTSEPETA